MDQHDRYSGGTGEGFGTGGSGTGGLGAGGMGTGGPANTPSFGTDSGALRTAADHQIPEETSPSHGAAGSSAGTQSAGPRDSGGDEAAQANREQLKERASQMAGQAEERLNQGMQQAADRIRQAARRLDSVADERLGGESGPKARAGQMAHSAADNMEQIAQYLQNADLQSLRADIERQTRERPLPTLMMAVAAGWLAGKILR